MVSSIGTLVKHLILKGNHSRVTSNVDLIVMIPEFVNFRVLTKIAESRKKCVPPLHPSGETWKSHDDLRVYHWRKAFDIAFQPDPVDPTHHLGCGLLFGFLSHWRCPSLQSNLSFAAGPLLSHADAIPFRTRGKQPCVNRRNLY